MLKKGICPVCYRVIKLTKHGKLYRHGWEGFYTLIKLTTGFSYVKYPCFGSGLKPLIKNKGGIL